METHRWLDFVSSKIKSEISLHNARKAENWAIALLGFLALSFAFASVGSLEPGSMVLFSSKVIFLMLFHLVMTCCVYLPMTLAKGEKPLAGIFGVRDFISLFVMALLLTFYAGVVCQVGFQAAGAAKEVGGSQFFNFIVWLNVIPGLFYFSLGLIFLAGVKLFPSGILKFFSGLSKAGTALLTVHLSFFALMFLGYMEVTKIGSPNFFEHLRLAGLFWGFIAASVILAARSFRPSQLEALSALELEITSGRIEKQEIILSRYKEMFVSRRLDAWLRQVSKQIATQAHDIAVHTHEAIQMVSREKPSEIDLRQVEERYRRAEAISQKMEKENARALLNFGLWNLNEVERDRAEALRDQFSKELRNAKIETASVRKKIDERLVALKAMERPPVPPPAAEVVTQEAVPAAKS